MHENIIKPLFRPNFLFKKHFSLEILLDFCYSKSKKKMNHNNNKIK